MAKFLFSVLTSILILSFNADAAHASATGFVTVRIDNAMTPSYPSSASTGTVYVTMIFRGSGGVGGTGGGTSITQMRVINTPREASDFLFDLGSRTYADIESVVVSLSSTPPASNDLFIIDQLYVLDTNGQVAYQNGIDNDIGFCISWQASDGTDAHCKGHVATGSYTFQIN